MICDRRRPFIALGLPLALSLAACGGSDEGVQENDERSATGEVLEGTISDAMLPVDRVRSQPPLLQEERGATGGDDVETSGEEAEGNDSAEVEPAPTEEAAADPEVAPPSED